MDASVKETLEKQLQMLSERSSTADIKYLPALTGQMINLARILEPELQNQSFYGASTGHPYVVQLPAKDLVDLYVARAELLSRQAKSHRI